MMNLYHTDCLVYIHNWVSSQAIPSARCLSHEFSLHIYASASTPSETVVYEGLRNYVIRQQASPGGGFGGSMLHFAFYKQVCVSDTLLAI